MYITIRTNLNAAQNFSFVFICCAYTDDSCLLIPSSIHLYNHHRINIYNLYSYEYFVTDLIDHIWSLLIAVFISDSCFEYGKKVKYLLSLSRKICIKAKVLISVLIVFISYQSDWGMISRVTKRCF